MPGQTSIINPLVVTAVFNTGIALVLHFMVIPDSRFPDVFVISQLTGLSICLCVRQAVIVSETVLKKGLIPAIAAGLISGVTAGGVLSGGICIFWMNGPWHIPGCSYRSGCSAWYSGYPSPISFWPGNG